MSNLRRKVENITIDNKKYIMAFDMASVDIFQDLTGKGVLKSVIALNKLEDKTVLEFIASTLRPVEDEENPLGQELFNGEYDLFTIMIMLVPTLISVVNNGFPKSQSNQVKNE